MMVWKSVWTERWCKVFRSVDGESGGGGGGREG